MKNILCWLCILMFAALLGGCDLDPFNSGCRNLSNTTYSLCRVGDGKVFYLEPINNPPEGGGLLHGAVRSIWWNGTVIVAWRQSTFRGDPDGLMIVDVARGKVSGPVSKKVILRKYPLAKLRASSMVWKNLPK